MKKKQIIILLITMAATTLYASYEEAVKLFEKGEYRKSLDILGQELVVADDMKPGSLNYNQRFLAAHNHWRLGNTASAMQHLRRCMDIKKDSVDPYIDMALIQIELKKYSDADETVRDGLKINNSAKLYYALGLVSLMRKNYWRAKDLFEKANSLDAELYYSYNALGVTLMNLKKYSEANTAFSVASAMRPNVAEIINNIGMSLEMQGKDKEAYQYYTKANDLDDENKIILENLSRIKKKLDQ